MKVLLTAKNKYQVTWPPLQAKISVNVGDILGAKVGRGEITLTPKTVVDRGVAKSVADFRARRAYGPFKTHEKFLSSLHAETKKIRSGKPSKRRRG